MSAGALACLPAGVDDYSVLYRFFASDGTLLYIGITQDLPARLRVHNKTKVDFRLVAYIRLEHFDSREEVLAAETAAIKAERPAWNKVHNNDTAARTGDRSRRVRPRINHEPTHVQAHQAAQLLDVKSRTTVSNYVNRGLLRCVYTSGGQRRIELASVRDLRLALAASDPGERTARLAELRRKNRGEVG